MLDIPRRDLYCLVNILVVMPVLTFPKADGQTPFDW